MSNNNQSSQTSPSSPPSQIGLKGISKEALFGIKKFPAKLVSAHAGRIPGGETEMPIMSVLFLDGKYNDGNVYLCAPLTDSIATSIAESGKELENGDVILMLPAPNPAKKVNWISVY
ncbi:MAG: hypothetical protein AB1782_10795 [Cyanobacteriota bacterium]